MTKLLTAKELAEVLNVHRVTLSTWRKKGLPVIKAPTGAVRYDFDEVMKWMNQDKGE